MSWSRAKTTHFGFFLGDLGDLGPLDRVWGLVERVGLPLSSGEAVQVVAAVKRETGCPRRSEVERNV